MFWLWVPEGQSQVRIGGSGTVHRLGLRADHPARERRLFGGEVTAEDADGASLFAECGGTCSATPTTGLGGVGRAGGLATTASVHITEHSDAGRPRRVGPEPVIPNREAHRPKSPARRARP